MAFFQCNCHSFVLESSYTLNVILPQSIAGQPAEGYPTLWLLHGLGNNASDWARRTRIERYALKREIAVVMPDGGRSFYKNIPKGLRYGDFFQEELHDLARSFFPLSAKRKDNFIAGLSMGGYGAFLLALSQPERYAAAASFSGPIDMPSCFANLSEDTPLKPDEASHLLSDVPKARGSKYDLIALAKQQLANGFPLPDLYACCGKQDFLHPCNLHFVTQAEKLSLPLTYEDWEGNHNWSLFDQMVAKFIDELPL